MPNQAPNQML
ncbi:hypothetical protein J0S82_012935 [Galemys pyrenaicus]|uniref:Uncharacterized protein n=1 Tax=Galemys pyrenaicus TaxID=202257 RepID=A0A8J6DLA4_GALPY|nr:hypothetical protein J0S82_012935 [Galemys pyrenaicus]